MHMSTRSNKGIGLLLVEPLDLERVIHKSKRSVDTLQAAIDSVEIQASINTVYPTSINTVHLTSIDTVHMTSIDTVHPKSIDTVHLTSIDTDHLTSIDIVHPTSIDTVHQSTIDTAHQPSIDTVHLPSIDTVHLPSDTTCLEAENVEVLILMVDENGMLRDEEGRTRNSTRQLINAHGAVIPDVIDVAEMNDFDLSREWYDWVGQDPFQGLPHQDPRNHVEELEDLVWDDIERAFLYKFLDDAEATREKKKNDKWERFLASLDEEYMIPIQLLDDIMAKRDEQHVSGELSRVEEAGTEDTTSTSTDGRTSTSTDGRTSTLTDGMTSTSIDSTTSTSINSTTSTSTNGTTSTSIDDVEKKVTMEDFLELEECLEDMDQNLEKKLDDDQHTSRGDLETSPKGSIDRHQPDEIDRQPADSIDLHPHSIIDRHTPEIVDRHPSLEELPVYIVELEPVEERVHESEASHNADSKHLRLLICTEEAVGFHKRVKRIYDPVKIVIP
uniref:Uncharacterized protein n=1 Tax=Brassica oleracea var. oleracea TaxID=109376 RepID=A0A0D3D7V5_BRAOL